MRLVRFRLLLLALPLLLLFAQLGAARHEIGHLTLVANAAGAVAASSIDGSSKKDLPLDKLCEVCLAFAHLGAAATPHVPAPPVVAVAHPRVPHDAVHAIAADAPALRSRGPPVTL